VKKEDLDVLNNASTVLYDSSLSWHYIIRRRLPSISQSAPIIGSLYIV